MNQQVKMNQQIKQMWVNALRSAEYTQDFFGLKSFTGIDRKVGFCVTGVLCDLHSKATGTLWDDEKSRGKYFGQMDVIPTEVSIWSGGVNNDTLLTVDLCGPWTADLVTLNDNGANFQEIADAIESQL